MYYLHTGSARLRGVALGTKHAENARYRVTGPNCLIIDTGIIISFTEKVSLHTGPIISKP